MIARVEMMNRIIYSQADIIFPRIQSVMEKHETSHSILPIDEDIVDAMHRARNDAIESATQFGMQIDKADIMKCELQMRNKKIDEDLDLDLESSHEEDVDLCETSFEQSGEPSDANVVEKCVEAECPKVNFDLDVM